MIPGEPSRLSGTGMCWQTMSRTSGDPLITPEGPQYSRLILQDDLTPDPDRVPSPGPLLLQHANLGQEDLGQHRPARLHQR